MNTENKIKKICGFYITATILIIIDQITKTYFGKLALGQTIPIIGDFLQFTHVENPGMAFGITFGWAKIFLSLFSIIASVFLFYYIYKIRNSKFLVKLGVAFIAAGAAGNLIDRVFYGLIYGYAPLFYGKVIDWVQVDIPDIHFLFINWTYFPIFNVADSSITVGACILILMYKYLPFLEHNKKENISLDTDNKVE